MRLQEVRAALARCGRVGSVDLAPLSGGQGMFAMLPLTAPQIALLQTDFGIYMAPTGRINIAGLTEDVAYFVDALHAVQHQIAA
jgi:aromatic-amino-acid transaminase